jgi:hypothetical protein
MDQQGTLTKGQIEHFRTFGFVLLREYVAAAEIAAIRADVDEHLGRAYAATPFDGSRRHWAPLLGKSQTLTSLAESARFYDAANALFDEGMLFLLADANRYVGKTPWHNDIGWHPDPSLGYDVDEVAAVKFALYLEPVTAERGALRVVPGSHREPYHSALGEYVFNSGYVQDVPDLPAVACETNPGDVVLFDWRLWHASIGGHMDRKMCTIDFFRKPRNEREADHIRSKAVHLNADASGQFARDGYPYYNEEWLASAGDNERRSKVIAEMNEIGLIDAVLGRR